MDTSPNTDSMNSSWLTKSPVSKSRRQHSCTRCRHHGMVEVRVLNHQCPYKSCTCSSCVLVKQRALMYRSKNSKSSQRDVDNEQYDVNSQDSPVGVSVPNYGSGSMDPTRNPRHQMLRASPAAVDSPTARSNFCPSPWDSKSSSGSSYSSSTPGVEWQHNQASFMPQPFPHSYQETPSVDGKIGDFRSLCMTFPDYSVVQLQAILEESGNDFDRAVDTILLKRWTDDQVKLPEMNYNPNSESSFISGSSYLSNSYDRQIIGPNHSPNHHPVSVQPQFAQNGYSGYSVGHYSNSNNVMAGSNAQHSVQPRTPQPQYPPQVLQQSHHHNQTSMTTASSLDHHQYNGTSYGSNACNYYGSPSPTETTYSSFSSIPSPQQQNHYNQNQPQQQQKILSQNPPNGSGYPGNSTGVTNGHSHSGYPYSSASHINRADQAMTYQDLTGGSANSYLSPRSFAATVVSQSQPTRQSLTETMLNQVRSPGSPGETYQQMVADDPLPLNEAMAVPIKRKRGRPKKLPGSPPVKRTIKKVAQESIHNNNINEHTVTTSAIFKVPQAVNDSPVAAAPISISPLSSLPDAQVNGSSQDINSVREDSSSWPISSPPQTDTTLNSSSPSSSLSSPPHVSNVSSSQVQPQPNESSNCELQSDLVITKTNYPTLTLITTNTTKTNEELNDRSTKLDSSRNLSRNVDEEQLIRKNSDLKSSGDSVAKSKSNRDSTAQGSCRRPVTRSSAHRFTSI